MIDEGKRKISEANKKGKKNALGHRLPQETKDFISNKLKVLWQDPKYREMMSKARKGRVFSKEHRAKLSKSSEATWENPVISEKIIQAMKVKASSKESREKKSQAVKKRWQNPETRQKLLNSRDHKRQSEIMKKKWQTLEYRNRMIKIHNSEETRKRRSENSKRLWQNAEFRKNGEERLRRNNRLGITNHPKMRYKIFSKLGRVGYRSSLELKYLESWEKEDFIRRVEVEPVRIPYEYENKKRIYIPDFLVYTPVSTYLVEIKSVFFLGRDKEIIAAKQERAEQYAREKGLLYVILSEKNLIGNELQLKLCA